MKNGTSEKVIKIESEEDIEKFKQKLGGENVMEKQWIHAMYTRKVKSNHNTKFGKRISDPSLVR